MEYFITFVIGAACGVIGGAIAAFFILRNNPKIFGIDKLLKNMRDKYAAAGQEKLDELKDKVKEIFG